MGGDLDGGDVGQYDEQKDKEVGQGFHFHTISLSTTKRRKPLVKIGPRTNFMGL